MTAVTARTQPPPLGPIPALAFAVDGAAVLPYAAVPTLQFSLRVDVTSGHPVRAIMLDVQIQIAARSRSYGPDAEERLFELFGPVADWGRGLRTLPWLRTTAVVPAFEGSATVPLAIPVTYDLEVSAARYLAALGDGEVPLEFLFAGSVFYADGGGALQTARIGWDQEVDYRLPVTVWREAMDRHFPGSAWLRLGAAAHGRLCAFKARHALPSIDAAVEALLDRADASGGGPEARA